MKKAAIHKVNKDTGISDPLRESFYSKSMRQITMKKKELFDVLAFILLPVAAVIYLMMADRIVGHNEHFWIVGNRFTFASTVILISLLISALVLGAYYLLAKRRLVPAIPVPGWLGPAAWVAILALPILYFAELRQNVAALSEAKPIEAQQWFLAENKGRCRRRRGLWRRCSHFFQDVKIYDRRGKHFRVSRYGDRTKYFCVLGQRVQSDDGTRWLKVERISPIKYERNYHGRITESGREDLVRCTWRDPGDMNATNPDW